MEMYKEKFKKEWVCIPLEYTCFPWLKYRSNKLQSDQTVTADAPV